MLIDLDPRDLHAEPPLTAEEEAELDELEAEIDRQDLADGRTPEEIRQTKADVLASFADFQAELARRTAIYDALPQEEKDRLARDDEARHAAMLEAWKPVTAIGLAYVPALAAKVSLPVATLQADLEQRTVIVRWCEEAHADRPDAVRISTDDADRLRAIWPPRPEEIPAEQWGPTASRTAAVLCLVY